MADSVRIERDCDALQAPHPQARRLLRLRAGSAFPLLNDYDRTYYRIACNGRLAYIPKDCATRMELTPAVTTAERLSSYAPVPTIGREPIASFPPPPAASGPLSQSTPAYPTIRAAIPAARPTPLARRKEHWFATLLRVAGFIFGLGLLLIGVSMMMAAAQLALSEETATGTGVGIGIGGGVVAAFGLSLIWGTYRTLFQFVVALSGLLLIIGGFQLLILAIPLSQVTAFDIDADAASVGLPVAGISLIVLGVVLATVMIVRWWRNPESRERLPDVTKWAAILFGGLLLLAGSAAVGLPAATAAEEYQPDLFDAAVIGAMIPFLIIPGGILALHGFTMSSRLGSGPFRFLPAWPLLGLFAAALALGAIVVLIDEPVIWLMSPAHAAAALLPALFLIAMAARGGLRLSKPIGGLSTRQLWLAFAVGIAVVTAVAGQINGMIFQALALALMASGDAFEAVGSASDLSIVLANADDYISDGQLFVLLMIVVVIFAPVMEEGMKAMGIALILPQRPTRAVAITLGVAVGAGFGVTEASFYGLGGLAGESEIEWWAVMLVRGGATSMHALNTAMLGLALYHGRVRGRLLAPLRLYAAAVLLHAFWNALAVIAGTRVVFSFEALSDRQLAMVSFAIMAPLAIATLTALYLLVRNAHRESPKAGEELELAPAT